MISGQFLNITPFFLAILRPLFRGHSIAHESSYVPLIETRRQKKPLEASTRNGEVKARARYVRVVERQHLVPPFPPSSHRIIPLFPSYPFYPCPVSLRLFSISPPLSLSLSRSFHPLCGHVPPSLPLSSLSSLRFRPLPLSRRYFRDDELQYAPIVAAGNQRAYPK